MSEINIREALGHLGGSLVLYRTLVKGFCDKYSSLEQEMENYIRLNEYEDAKRLAHSMKGLSGNLGVKTLQEKAKDLESGFKELINLGEEAVISEELNEIKDQFIEEHNYTICNLKCLLKLEDSEIEKIKGFVDIEGNQDECEGIRDPSIIEFLNEESKLKVNILIRALSSYNYETIKMALGALDKTSLSKVNGSNWVELSDFISNYEYDKAKYALVEGVLNER